MPVLLLFEHTFSVSVLLSPSLEMPNRLFLQLLFSRVLLSEEEREIPLSLFAEQVLFVIVFQSLEEKRLMPHELFDAVLFIMVQSLVR